MTELAFTKGIHGVLPLDPETGKYLQKLKLGEVIRADFKRARNYPFLCKFMAMVTVAFDHFECAEVEYRGEMIKPEKDFDEFRKWLVIKAGFFYVVGYPDGGVRVRAKSLSFANMSEEKFEKVYSAVLDVILAKVVDMPREEYEQLVDKVMEFA